MNCLRQTSDSTFSVLQTRSQLLHFAAQLVAKLVATLAVTLAAICWAKEFSFSLAKESSFSSAMESYVAMGNNVEIAS